MPAKKRGMPQGLYINSKKTEFCFKKSGQSQVNKWNGSNNLYPRSWTQSSRTRHNFNQGGAGKRPSGR